MFLAAALPLTVRVVTESAIIQYNLNYLCILMYVYSYLPFVVVVVTTAPPSLDLVSVRSLVVELCCLCCAVCVLEKGF